MKKLLLSLVVVSVIGMVSCKKDETTKPQKSSNLVTNDKRDLGTGD